MSKIPHTRGGVHGGAEETMRSFLKKYGNLLIVLLVVVLVALRSFLYAGPIPIDQPVPDCQGGTR